jgi:hypothetical protein
MKLATDVYFIKRFGAIYAAIGLLPYILTQVMPPGALPKKFYEIGHWYQFHKTLVQFTLLLAYCLKF